MERETTEADDVEEEEKRLDEVAAAEREAEGLREGRLPVAEMVFRGSAASVRVLVLHMTCVRK